ncbi:MAG: hypothetical protein LBP80_09455 [Treponema sp.]|nr:hypothetical protein [Treponema sp.]
MRLPVTGAFTQGNSTYFLIVKIYLNSPEFPGKINHNEPLVRGAQRMHEVLRYSFLLRLCDSKFFNVLINFSLGKVSAVALAFTGPLTVRHGCQKRAPALLRLPTAGAFTGAHAVLRLFCKRAQYFARNLGCPAGG